MRNPKRLQVAAIFSIILTSSTPSFAADVEALPTATWSGAYIGLDAGYLWSNFNWQNIEVDDRRFPYNPRGAFAAIHAGYNHQWDSFLLGAEARLKFGDLERGPVVSTINGAADPNWRGTGEIGLAGDLRARLGFIAGDVMPYITGGLAIANVDYDIANLGVTAYSNKETLYGWTAGAGVEWAMSESISLRAQYLYADYKNFSADPAALLAYEIDVRTHDASLGLSFHF